MIGDLVGFAFIGLAWFFRHYEAKGPGLLFEPAWLILLLFGVTLLFCSRFSLHNETTTNEADWDEMEDMDYDSIYNESQYFDFTDESENIAYSQWLIEKQEARRETEIRREEEEDRRADEILQKLHKDGLKSLTDEERSLLDRVSSRLRRRRQQGV